MLLARIEVPHPRTQNKVMPQLETKLRVNYYMTLQLATGESFWDVITFVQGPFRTKSTAVLVLRYVAPFIRSLQSDANLTLHKARDHPTRTLIDDTMCQSIRSFHLLH